MPWNKNKTKYTFDGATAPLIGGAHRTCPEPLQLVKVGVLLKAVDGTLDEATVGRLRDSTGHATYPHRNFCGIVWYEDGQFWMDVLRKKLHNETLTAPTVELLVSKALGTYGAR